MAAPRLQDLEFEGWTSSLLQNRPHLTLQPLDLVSHFAPSAPTRNLLNTRDPAHSLFSWRALDVFYPHPVSFRNYSDIIHRNHSIARHTLNGIHDLTRSTTSVSFNIRHLGRRSSSRCEWLSSFYARGTQGVSCWQVPVRRWGNAGVVFSEVQYSRVGKGGHL